MFSRNKNTSTHNGAGTVSGPARTTRSHSLIQHLLRALQFLSAFTSLILFSVRLAKILRLVHKASHSNGAVEGILAAAVLYTLIATALTCGLRAGGGNMLRILLIIFDLLFVGAFIAVAVLTSPKRHGSSGPCTSNANANHLLTHYTSNDVNCRLPWGTFILAILSTLLHAATAAFHGVKDHRRTHRNDHVTKHEAAQNDGRDGYVDGNAPGYNGARATHV
ncbi:uncharacterized protein LY89DRAFT_651143 [Mollisia scopiformis]|uniref:MARVEL domain-containing protein n=1 Tax=Mollisia scopiformis TaxID=149040 RepID=A0A194X1K4_MOLSC|nr:uncharacterized protein LY89DRAFT_651143 [Mollisia scopiformis]KUJ14075.1 hypothetical protein LY89DRAFT_651143 [Mollisia scopiformis]